VTLGISPAVPPQTDKVTRWPMNMDFVVKTSKPTTDSMRVTTGSGLTPVFFGL
jgi:hypothetical protein